MEETRQIVLACCEPPNSTGNCHRHIDFNNTPMRICIVSSLHVISRLCGPLNIRCIVNHAFGPWMRIHEGEGGPIRQTLYTSPRLDLACMDNGCLLRLLCLRAHVHALTYVKLLDTMDVFLQMTTATSNEDNIPKPASKLLGVILLCTYFHNIADFQCP